MKKKCYVCGEKLSKRNHGFLECLSFQELKRFEQIGAKNTNICLDCKKDLLFSSIVSPY